MSGEGMGYDAARIEVLEGREAVRKRPGMWVGSTGERGLYQMVFEVVDWAVNEGLATGSGFVSVTLTPDGGVRVTDDGPGVPFEAGVVRGTDAPGLEALLTTPRPGPEREGRHIVAVSHPGAGLLVPNALSSRLTAEVRRDGVLRVQEYARGVPVAPPATVSPATGSGTTITFWPDADIFETTQCSFAVLAERFRQVAFLNRGLGISLTEERAAGDARAVLFRFPDGVRDFVAALDAETGAGIHPDILCFECEDPRMAGTMEVALMWMSSHKRPVRGFTNSRATQEGGTHVDGFLDGVVGAVTAYARQRGLLGAADPGPDAVRIGECCTAVVSVKLDRPEFLGATRGLLGNADVRGCVDEAVRRHLGDWFEERPEWATRVVNRVVGDDHRD